MSNLKKISITAKSLDQAITKASYELGIEQKRVMHTVEKESGAKGLFSFLKSPSITISAWEKVEQKSRPEKGQKKSSGRYKKNTSKANKAGASRAKVEQAVPKLELSSEKVDELKEELRDYCIGICQRVAGDEGEVSVSAEIEGDRLVLNIKNEYITGQVVQNSKLAEALEHVLRKKPRHIKQDLPFRIFLDVGNLRQDREQELIKLANEFSSKVKTTMEPLTLNYKSSYDRKIIHMALDKDSGVYTKSIGSGPNRKLMIVPVEDGAASEQLS